MQMQFLLLFIKIMSKLSFCNLTPDPKEAKSMPGVFRQNSDKSSVYSDAATGDSVTQAFAHYRIYQDLSAILPTHTQYVSEPFQSS
jgi:hypothetical protein